MPGAYLWGWYPTTKKWVKLKVDADGSIHIVGYVDKLGDIGDVNVPTPGDNEVLYWKADPGEWQSKANWVAAHKNSHDPQDGSDPLDTAAPVKVGEANAKGTSHSLARADHVHEKHHAKYTDAEAVDAIEADDNLPLASITFIIDGGGSAIVAAEEKGHLRIPFACTINRVTMLADVSGSIVVDIWKDTYANFPPTNADSITAAAPPTITTAQKSEDSTLTGWTTAIAAGDILAFNVDSCTTITRVTISLKVVKT